MIPAGPSPRRGRSLSRRQALAELALGGAGLLIAGCGASSRREAAADGSTLESTWGDPRGEGELETDPGGDADRPH